MPDYQKGQIYKLWSPQGEEDEIYIGSTTQLLYKRKASHKSNKKCRSKILFEKYDDVRIELIEEYPCNNKAELNKKEGEYIKENKCLNRCIAGRTIKEWCEDNKEDISKKSKEYRIIHKDHKQDYDKDYYKYNKEQILQKQKEQYEKKKERIREYKKQYYKKNKENISKKSKEYYINNQEHLKANNNDYYINNKDVVLKKMKEYYKKKI
jgi:hypothetical protein